MTKSKEKKPWYKTTPAIIVFIIVGLAIIGSFSGNDESTTTQQAITDSQAQQNTAPAPEPVVPTTYSLGEPVQAGDFQWTIKSVTKESEIGERFGDTLVGETADGVFLIFDVEVKNTANSAKYLQDDFLKLVDNQGRAFSASTASLYLGDESFLFDEINPGITKKGKVVFDVPEDIQVVDIRISPSMFSNSFSVVKAII